MKKVSKAIASAISALIAVAVVLGVNVPEAFNAEMISSAVTLAVSAVAAFGVTYQAPKNAE